MRGLVSAGPFRAIFYGYFIDLISISCIALLPDYSEAEVNFVGEYLFFSASPYSV